MSNKTEEVIVEDVQKVGTITTEDAIAAEDTIKEEVDKEASKLLKAEKAAAKKALKKKEEVAVLEDTPKEEEVAVLEDTPKEEEAEEVAKLIGQLTDTLKDEIKSITRHIGITGLYNNVITKFENGTITFDELKETLIKRCRISAWRKKAQELKQ